eukprot:7526588-Lingulodinium_polyedra.AAC.1
MAALRGAARGGPRAQPLSSRAPCVRRAGMSQHVLTAKGVAAGADGVSWHCGPRAHECGEGAVEAR